MPHEFPSDLIPVSAMSEEACILELKNIDESIENFTIAAAKTSGFDTVQVDINGASMREIMENLSKRKIEITERLREIGKEKPVLDLTDKVSE